MLWEFRVIQARFLFLVVALVLVAPILTAKTTDPQAPKELTNSIGMRLVLIPKGTFTMGSPRSKQLGDWVI